MATVSLVLFALTYAGIAIGRIPGLALDRTGFALLGAVAFLALGLLDLESAKAAVDAPTIVVLFGMMLLSVQYQLSGLYTAIGDRLARTADRKRLLAGTIVVTAGLSAILTNDVVCFALTPLVASALRRTRMDPLPFLFAIACASNLGSALTPIGNPQNILIAQKLDLQFLPFVLACAAPVVLSLGFLYWFLSRRLPDREGDAPGPVVPLPPPVPLDRPEAAKALVLTAAAVVLFLVPTVPTYLTALAIGGVVLTSRRMHTRSMLALVDWHMLALFAGLFVVIRGVEDAGWTVRAAGALRSSGADLSSPLVYVPSVIVLGNLVGNVPAVMLMLPFISRSPTVGYGLALSSTLAGNAFLVGSVANLIVAEQAERLGIPIRFGAHLRVGLPVAAFSLIVAAAFMALW